MQPIAPIGENMPKVTIYTLAKELNMTPSMVSRAFHPKAKISKAKRQLVLETAEKYGFSPNKLASRLSMKAVRIGVMINSRFQINTDKMISGIKKAHEKLKDYKIQYDISVLDPAQATDANLCEIIERYKSYDGIILTGMSSENYTNLINELHNANPNVVQVQAINRNANCLFASKHNERIASELAAEFLHHCLRRAERKNILLFTGDLKSALHASAADAFKISCDTLGLHLLQTVDMKDNEDYFESILPETFARCGNQADGIYITSGFSVPLCRFLEAGGNDIPFVAFDTYEDMKSYMQKGIISATVSQNVEAQMEKAFELLVKHIITGEDSPKTVYTDVQLVLKSNMHQFN